MSELVRARNILAEDEIERYLRTERLNRALRLLWAGLVATILGAAGTAWVYRWLTSGGVMLKVALAAPFAVLAGVPLTLYGGVLMMQELRRRRA
jgi:hypothetical protein